MPLVTLFLAAFVAADIVEPLPPSAAEAAAPEAAAPAALPGHRDRITWPCPPEEHVS